MTRNAEFLIEEVRDLDAAWPALEALLRDSHEHYLPIVGFGPPDDWAGPTQDRFRPGDDALVLIATCDGRPVAFANAMVRTSPGSPPQRFVYLDNVYVLERFRGKGIGHEIFLRVESWARDRGVDQVRLEVLAVNPHAFDFWGRLGFRPRAYQMSKSLSDGETS